jgi:hypothetical protein
MHGTTAKSSIVAEAVNGTTAVSMETMMQALQRLPSTAWPDVLQFIEFMEYKWQNDATNTAEDAALWRAVEAEQAHRRAHPEDVVVYRSMEELAAALDADE